MRCVWVLSPPVPACRRRISSSGMKRSSSRSSGELDKLQSRMGRTPSNTALGVESSPSSYRGPFGHLGADPDADFASVTTGSPPPPPPPRDMLVLLPHTVRPVLCVCLPPCVYWFSFPHMPQLTATISSL